MKLTFILLTAAVLQVAARSEAQSVSLDLKNVYLDKVFNEIRKQTGFMFLYDNLQLRKVGKVSVRVKNAAVETVLEQALSSTGFDFKIIDNTIVLTQKSPNAEGGDDALPPPPIDISGKVTDEDGNPLVGASVKVKGTNQGTTTDVNGVFVLKGVDENAVLEVSYAERETMTVEVKNRTSIIVAMNPAVESLQEVVVNKGYYTEKQRLSTSNVGKITASDIEKQPVSNPLATLQGRIPGLIVTQSSGLPGSSFDVQIRGRNSINNGNDPLYIIDGVPFNNETLDRVYLGYMSQQSPLNSINTQDIESIEVLKDADATAIYGSRGANGVILITTKKGRSGKTNVSINFSKGWGTVPTPMKFMNTQQYVQMRNEAFNNDNRSMTQALAYDLLVWDTTRYTDWQKLLIGGTSDFTNAQSTLSGGNAQTQFLLGTNYYRETTVFPADLSFHRGSGYLTLNHSTNDKKFTANLTTMYNADRNRMIRGDLINSVDIAPNSPLPYDDNGNLVWSEGGFTFNNPLGILNRPYTSTNQNLVSNLSLHFRIHESFTAKLSTGYTNTQLNQTAITPKSSQNPSTNSSSSATFGEGSFKSYIIEPNVDYQKQIGSGKLEALIGTSFQQEISEGTTLNGTNYNSEAMLNSIAGAGSVTTSYNYGKYRYQSIFGRIKYNYNEKYILNITGRGDGSSRFGSNAQYHTFGAIGAAWIFTEENLIKKNSSILSFGKIRMSFGTSGNDKIGDYNYLDTWRSTANPYQGVQGLQPSSLYNPDYAWEINRKFELGLEMGLVRDRIHLSISYFRNRSGNQLVQYSLPAQTGFSGITKNLPALVQNTGSEFLLNTTNINSINFKWVSSLNVTIAKNKLVDFPGLATSSYANTYVIGRSLNIVKLIDFIGVDPQTGVYIFNGTSLPKDQTVIKDLTPKFYGGFYNMFTWKNLELSFLFQFIKQENFNYGRRNISGGENPGRRLNNYPVEMLERWQKVGDEKLYQIYTTGSNGQAANGYLFYAVSDAVISDASFIRLKNASISYKFSDLIKRWRVQQSELFIQAQNLFTITNYFGFDPENQGAGLPPLRVINIGFKLSF